MLLAATSPEIVDVGGLGGPLSKTDDFGSLGGPLSKISSCESEDCRCLGPGGLGCSLDLGGLGGALSKIIS
jgi:hypothetical protein